MPDAAQAGGLQRGHRDAGIVGGNQENRCPGISFGRNQEGVGDGAEADLGAGAGQPVAGAGADRLHRSLAHLRVEGDGQRLFAADRRHAPALLQLLGAEPGQRPGAQHHRLQVGHRGQLVTQCHQDRDLLERAEAVAAQRCRRRAGQDAGVDQLGPQVAVEALFEAVELALVFGCADRVHDGVDQVAEIVRRFGGGEVHERPSLSADAAQRLRGSPSATMPMMSRCTSLVPPPKVRIKHARCIRSTRPRSRAPGES
ncbi:hypothetical protein PICSAR7_04275 [Mycobacterium avium subsp. paratuberculosis]|nr:hypothetical protein PICSAR7_04275 [Mycobacterium avium subsp. paratuberculosis]